MLVVLSVVEGGSKDAQFSFPPGEYMFGRSDECDVVLVHRAASRKHFVLRVTDDSAFVQDLGSRNKTLVNQNVVTGDRPLDDGDYIYVGGIGIRFRVHMYPDENDASISHVPRQKALYQLGASPDDPTAAINSETRIQG